MFHRSCVRLQRQVLPLRSVIASPVSHKLSIAVAPATAHATETQRSANLSFSPANANSSRRRNRTSVRVHIPPPHSVFFSPTSKWKDFFRTQMQLRYSRRAQSPFVRRQYKQFVRLHPEMNHCGLPTYLSPSLHALVPAFSYERYRRLKLRHPQAAARRSSLVRWHLQHMPLINSKQQRLRTLRTFPRMNRWKNYESPPTLQKLRARWKYLPQRPYVKHLARHSRRRWMRGRDA